MVAVSVAGSEPSMASALWLCAVVAVAAAGVGPCASWIASMPQFSVKRFVSAFLLAALLAFGMVMASGALSDVRRQAGAYDICGDDYWMWFPISWAYCG